MQITTSDMKVALFDPSRQKTLQNFFKSDDDVNKFCSSVLRSMEKIPDLANCTKESLLTAFMTCAELRIYPSTISGEAYVIPYQKNGRKEAQFQLGYMGVITLLYRCGAKNVNAQVVFEKDFFEYEEGLQTRLVHRPNVFEDRGKPIGAYAVVTLATGEQAFKVMSGQAIEQVRKNSKSTVTDPELWMWKKTVLKQLAKLLPKNEEIVNAIAIDNEDNDFEEVKKDVLRDKMNRASTFDVSLLATPTPPPTIDGETGEILQPTI